VRRVLMIAVAACALFVFACRSSRQEEHAAGITPAPTATAVTAAVTATATATAPEPAPSPELTPTPLPTPTPAPPPPPPVAVPVRLRIPSIGVDARIIPVGVTPSGEMQSPPDAWTVGWYADGYKPSEPGNAVIAGHVDYVNVGAAVFWNLRRLAPGDQVVVIDADEGENDAPVSTIFGPNPNHGLNLITCDGVFNPRTHDYNQRLVVYTEEIAPPPPPAPPEPSGPSFPSHHLDDDVS
jgi:hypothetical protein